MRKSNKSVLSYAKKTYPLSLIFIIALVLSGCNDEVFVGKLDPSDTELTIGGNGDRASVGYESDKLETLSLDVFSEEKPNVSYFDSDGNQIQPEKNASRLAKIKYKSLTAEYEIKVGSSVLMIESIENFSTLNTNVTIRLDYGFAVRFIHVVMTGLPKIDCLEISYDMGLMSINSEPTIVSRKINCKNDDSSEWNMSLKPYLQMPAYVELEPTEKWARYMKDVYAIPTLQGGEWGLHGTEVEMSMSTKGYFSSTEVDNNTSVPITIPPLGAKTVLEKVFFASMSVPFRAVFKNPVTGREYSTSGICTVCEPFDYEVIVSEKND